MNISVALTSPLLRSACFLWALASTGTLIKCAFPLSGPQGGQLYCSLGPLTWGHLCRPRRLSSWSESFLPGVLEAAESRMGKEAPEPPTCHLEALRQRVLWTCPLLSPKSWGWTLLPAPPAPSLFPLFPLPDPHPPPCALPSSSIASGTSVLSVCVSLLLSVLPFLHLLFLFLLPSFSVFRG